jgi:hypothetical protein
MCGTVFAFLRKKCTQLGEVEREGADFKFLDKNLSITSFINKN